MCAYTWGLQEWTLAFARDVHLYSCIRQSCVELSLLYIKFHFTSVGACGLIHEITSVDSVWVA